MPAWWLVTSIIHPREKETKVSDPELNVSTNTPLPAPMLIRHGNSLAGVALPPLHHRWIFQHIHLRGLCFPNHENELVSWHWNWTELTGIKFNWISVQLFQQERGQALNSPPFLQLHASPATQCYRQVMNRTGKFRYDHHLQQTLLTCVYIFNHITWTHPTLADFNRNYVHKYHLW